MIVRISGEDQYELDDEQRARLTELEAAVVEMVEQGRRDAFSDEYQRLLSHVRSNGRRVGHDELLASDVILPPADLSFAEAGRDFTGEGLIPD